MEDPSVDLRFVVTEWVVGRAGDPYAGVRRQIEVGSNFWFGTVPGSRGRYDIVTCNYWIDEELRTVRCDHIATLQLPL